MGVCPICNKDVLRGDGFVVQEFYEPNYHKIYIHHSKWDKCLEQHFANEREKDEETRKAKLGLPANPLDDLLDTL